MKFRWKFPQIVLSRAIIRSVWFWWCLSVPFNLSFSWFQYGVPPEAGNDNVQSAAASTYSTFVHLLERSFSSHAWNRRGLAQTKVEHFFWCHAHGYVYTISISHMRVCMLYLSLSLSTCLYYIHITIRVCVYETLRTLQLRCVPRQIASFFIIGKRFVYARSLRVRIR